MNSKAATEKAIVATFVSAVGTKSRSELNTEHRPTPLPATRSTYHRQKQRLEYVFGANFNQPYTNTYFMPVCILVCISLLKIVDNNHASIKNYDFL